MPRAIPIEDEIGKRYGRLTVVEFDSYLKQKRGRDRIYSLLCDCGRTIKREISIIRTGHTSSCGCLWAEKAHRYQPTHGEGRAGKVSAEYTTWQNMKSRCFNTGNSYWYNYGGRGITVCAHWKNSYENFLADMGRKPTPRHSLDRIDNNGNYEPGNCRWATRETQNKNSRHYKPYTTKDGIIDRGEVALHLGITTSGIRDRIKKLGWSVEDAVSIPKGKRRC